MILRCYTVCYVVLYLFIFLCSNVNCFNIDVQNYVKHRGNPNSMFGFSVALHRENQNSWLIVGAPTAQTAQPGVERGGAVYRCDINNDNNCSLIDFDTKGDRRNINDSDGKQVDMKSNQWFGATVTSSGEDGIVLACAPRYMWFTTIPNRRDPVGTCYVAKNEFKDFAEYSPCRTRNWGYHRQGSCQAGLGASVSRDGRRLYVGAPGSWYWQGQLHSVDAFARLPYVPPRFTLIEEGQVISQSTHARPDVISTREGPSTDDDSYLGYSVAVGEFGGGSGGFNDVAVGMPRGEGLVGKVVVYSWNMTNLKNFTGEQLGAYFGYSLAVCDVDGDSRDDILVGAPLYTDLSDKKGYYETGRVYILYQGAGDYLWMNIQVRDGTNSRSRFGTALTSLGDLNLDGYGDFAVGAPYDGPKQRGAVYIYLGSNRGARDKPSQTIFAEQVDGLPSTFGFSLAGGLDLDENLYPDLLIGAYDSSTTIFLRTRPVVNVDAKLDFLLPSKQISLEEKNCSLRDRTRVPCVELNTCLNYTGVNVDRRLEFEIQFILDSKKPHSPRMFFVSEENRNTMNQTIRLDKNKQFCKKTTVYIKPNVRDKLTSLEAEMRYGLKLSESSRRAGGKLIYPVLDKSKQEEHSKRDIILIQKDCGRDNVCIPDLRLIATPSVNRYLLGSGERLEIDVVVQNEGEDAFEAIYELQVPSGLNYVKIEKADRDGKDLMPVLCSPPSYLNNNTLHCDIGNPLPKEKIVHFKVILQPYRLEGLKPRYDFFMYVNSTNPEVSSSTSDNQMRFKVPIWVETDLILQGSSQPIDVHYNVSLYQSVENILQESDIGPQVTHTYTIRNKGPSDILEAEAFILWPSYTLAGEHLFYLLDQPEVSGQVRCEQVQDVNSERINMERRRQNQFENNLSSAVHSSLTGSERVSGSRVTGSSSSRVSGSSSSWSSSSSSSSGGHRGQSISAEERRRIEEARIREEEAARERWRQSQSGGSLESGSHTSSRTEGERHSSWSSSGSSSRGSSSRGSGSGITTSGGGRVEASRTEHSSSWSSNRGNAYGFDLDRDRDTSGGIGMDREIIVDARGSNIGSGSWSSSSGSRYPDSSSQGSSYNATRTEHRTSGDRYSGSGRDTGRDESFRVRQPGSDSHFEERHYERNSTWNSNDRKPQVSTSWSVNKDGKIETGGYRGEADGSETLVENKDGSYFGHKDKTFNDTWMVSEGNRGVSGSYDIRHEGTRWSERPSGSRNYSEERSSTRNTSWTSQGGPAVTSEHSSWSVNRDGLVKNGSNSRVYHEKDDYGRDKFGYDSSREKTDRNSLRGGSRTFSEEKEIVRNTTWTGSGKPKTEETNRWKVEKDGVVSSGGSSRTYEGSSEHREGYGGSVSSIEGYGSTREGYGSTREGYESTREGFGSTREGYGSTREGYGTSREGYGSTRTSGGRISSTVYDERSSQSGRGSSQDEFSSRGSGHSSWGASGSSRGSSQSETSKEERREESHGRVATNTNIGDLLNSRNNNFGGLGDIAVGPKGGVARTYTLDLGVLEGKKSESRDESRGSSGERISGSGSRLYTAESGSGERHSGSSVHTSEGGERHSSGGYTSSGSRHYEFGSSGGRSGSRSESHYSSRGGGFSATRNEDSGGYSGASEASRSGGYSSASEASRSGGYSGASEVSRSGGYSSSSEVSRSGGYAGASEGSRSGGGSWRYSSTSGTADGDSIMNGGMYSRRQEHSSSSSSSSHYSSRSRRQADDVEDFDSTLKCENTKCITIRCTAGPLKKDDEVVIKVRARVWVHTLKQLGSWKQVNVSSLLTARVSRLPHIGRPDVSTTRNYEIVTPLVPRLPPPPPEVVPLWIIVLSACAGAILLMLLVFILYKLGFFKRNRPSNSPEKQPLNRNGHYPGDEQL